MHAQELAQERGSEGCGCGEDSPGPFRRTIAALEESWAAEARRAPYFPFVTWTPEGPRLGAATLLARKGAGEEARLLALLSVAYGFAVPGNGLKHLAWAETEFDRGNLAKSAIHVALTGLPAFTGREVARRLHIAAGILDHGFLTPLDLMKACEFDCGEVESLAKYNADEPRVAAGNPDGGQWTRDGAAEPSSRTGCDPRISDGPREVAVLTGNFDYACRALGLDPDAASKILHALKRRAGLSGADQCTFDTETGDVFHGDEHIGNLNE